jgi:hypothetical protein
LKELRPKNLSTSRRFIGAGGQTLEPVRVYQANNQNLTMQLVPNQFSNVNVILQNCSDFDIDIPCGTLVENTKTLQRMYTS